MSEHLKREMIIRKSHFYIYLIIFAYLIFYSSSAVSEKPRYLDDLEDWNKGTAIIQTHPNRSIKFKVLIAESNKERRQGLMHIEAMDNDEGMLFIFDPGRNVSMWMRNTPMTLDMIFINKEGRIINIAKNTTPYSTKGISSGGTINWVLEINGGLSDRMNIKNGDLVRFNLIRDPCEE